MRLHNSAHTAHFTVFKRVTSFLVVLCLVSCAATGPAFTPHGSLPQGEGVVYIYRTSPHLSLISAIIEVDGKHVVNLEVNGYAAIPIKAGDHTITQRWKAGVFGNSKLEGRPVAVKIRVTEGASNFVRLSASVESSHESWYTVRTRFAWALREIAEPVARAEIAVTRRTELVQF